MVIIGICGKARVVKVVTVVKAATEAKVVTEAKAKAVALRILRFLQGPIGVLGLSGMV